MTMDQDQLLYKELSKQEPFILEQRWSRMMLERAVKSSVSRV